MKTMKRGGKREEKKREVVFFAGLRPALCKASKQFIRACGVCLLHGTLSTRLRRIQACCIMRLRHGGHPDYTWLHVHMHRVSVVTNAIMNVTIRRNSHGSPVVTQFDPSVHVMVKL